MVSGDFGSVTGNFGMVTEFLAGESESGRVGDVGSGDSCLVVIIVLMVVVAKPVPSLQPLQRRIRDAASTARKQILKLALQKNGAISVKASFSTVAILCVHYNYSCFSLTV